MAALVAQAAVPTGGRRASGEPSKHTRALACARALTASARRHQNLEHESSGRRRRASSGPTPSEGAVSRATIASGAAHQRPLLWHSLMLER
jgi:hypothetical protein